MSQETDNPYLDIPAKLSCWDVFSLLGFPIESRTGKFKSPFREDRTASFSVFNDGSKWKDHATGEHGDIFDLVIMAKGCDKKEALRFLAEQAGFTLVQDQGGLPIPPRRNKASRNPPKLPTVLDPLGMRDHTYNALRDLCRREGVITELLMRRKGIRAETVKRLIEEGSLGSTDPWSSAAESRRMLYLMERGVKCRPVAETSHRDFWVDGTGSNNLFRGNTLLDEPEAPVMITEGETDCIAALDKLTGIKALWAGALGASWAPDFRVARRYFKGRQVFIIGDHDKAGHDFGKRLQHHLRDVAGVKDAKVFNWMAMNAPEGTDIGDMLAPSESLAERIAMLTFFLRDKNSWV